MDNASSASPETNRSAGTNRGKVLNFLLGVGGCIGGFIAAEEGLPLIAAVSSVSLLSGLARDADINSWKKLRNYIGEDFRRGAILVTAIAFTPFAIIKSYENHKQTQEQAHIQKLPEASPDEVISVSARDYYCKGQRGLIQIPPGKKLNCG